VPGNIIIILISLLRLPSVGCSTCVALPVIHYTTEPIVRVYTLYKQVNLCSV